MFRNVFTKSLYTLRWQLLGWCLAVFFIVLLTMSLFNALSQQGIDQIVGQVPDSLKSLIGSVNDYVTIPGYIGQQIFGPNLVIITMIMAVLLYVSASAGEEDRGLMQTNLSLPVSRSKYYFQKLLAVTLVIAIVCLIIAPAIYLGLLTVGHQADWSRVWLSILSCFLMNVAYGLVAYAIAMLSGKKGLTIAVSAGYAVVSFIISSLAPAVDKLTWPDRFSIFHYYNNPQIMSAGFSWKHFWILLAISLVLTLIGWWGFTRRDVRSS